MEKRYTLFKQTLENQRPHLLLLYNNYKGVTHIPMLPPKGDLELLPLCEIIHEQWYKKLRLRDRTSAEKLFEGMEKITLSVLKSWVELPLVEYFPPSHYLGVENWLQETADGLLDMYIDSYRWIENDALYIVNMRRKESNWGAWLLSTIKDIKDVLLKQALVQKQIEDKDVLRTLEAQKNSSQLKDRVRHRLQGRGMEIEIEQLRAFPYLFKNDSDINHANLKLIFDTDIYQQNVALLATLQEKKKLDREHKQGEKQALWIGRYNARKAAAIRKFALDLERLPLFEVEQGTPIGNIEFQECAQSNDVRYFLDHICMIIMRECSRFIERDLQAHRFVIEKLQKLGAVTKKELSKDFGMSIRIAKASVIESLSVVLSKPSHAVALIDSGMTLNEYLKDHLLQLETSRLFAPLLTLQIPLSLPFASRQRHCYILGKSGSGKTELLKQLIYSDVQDGKGVFVLDPHGDLAEECLQFALFEDEAIRKRLVYISPEFITKGYIPQYNPFEYKLEEGSIEKQRNDISVRAAELAGAFQVILKSEFTPNMELLLLNCIRLLLEVPETHIGDFVKMLYPNGLGSGPYANLLETHWDDELRDYFEHIFPAKRLATAKSAIITRFTKTLSNQFVKNMLYCKTSSFDFKTLLDEGKIIIVNAKQAALSEGGTNILGALLTAEMTIMALGRANKPKADRQPVFAYIDECQNFLNDKIDKLLAEARKYGVHLTMANQFLGQFNGMGRLKASIFANTAIKFCGNASAQDKAIMSRELDFDFDSTEQLGKGRFVCRIDPYKGMVVQASSVLLPPLENNSNYTSQEQLNILIEEQLRLYYRQFVAGKEGEQIEDISLDEIEKIPNIDDTAFDPFIEEL